MPGVGDNEDDGTMLTGAVGPAYAFLIGVALAADNLEEGKTP